MKNLGEKPEKSLDERLAQLSKNAVSKPTGRGEILKLEFILSITTDRAEEFIEDLHGICMKYAIDSATGFSHIEYIKREYNFHGGTIPEDKEARFVKKHA